MRIVILLVALGLDLIWIAPAHGAGQLCVGSESGSAIDCSGDRQTQVVPVNQSVSPTGDSRRSTQSTTQYIPYDRLDTQGGEDCITTGYYPAGSQPNDAIGLDPVTQNVREIHGLPALEYPPCPIEPAAQGDPSTAIPETPSMIARRYWEQVGLPVPQPSIQPGRAIAGKLAYLETRGEVVRTYTNETVFGRLEIRATGSYTISWGDDSSSGPYAFEGRPWPEGKITHDYSHIGTYNIVVTERWVASWSLGGQSGSLRALQTIGRVDNFPVQEIQAVVGA